jgi:hypothetical protein
MDLGQLRLIPACGRPLLRERGPARRANQAIRTRPLRAIRGGLTRRALGARIAWCHRGVHLHVVPQELCVAVAYRPDGDRAAVRRLALGRH